MPDDKTLDYQLDAATAELEAALRQIRPAPVSMQRDELLFKAGAASVQHRLGRWRNATLAMAACAAISVAMQIDTHRSPTVVRSHETQPPAMLVTRQPTAITASPYSLASLNRTVRDGGIEAIPTRGTVDSADSSLSSPQTPTLFQSLHGDPL
jgi:hypothetical protein